MTATITPPAATTAPRPPRKRRRSSGPAGGSGKDAWLLVLPALIPIVIYLIRTFGKDKVDR